MTEKQFPTLIATASDYKGLLELLGRHYFNAVAVSFQSTENPKIMNVLVGNKLQTHLIAFRKKSRWQLKANYN